MFAAYPFGEPYFGQSPSIDVFVPVLLPLATVAVILSQATTVDISNTATVAVVS